MEVVEDYKYLGVRLDSRGSWAGKRREALAKARRSLWRGWGLGMGGCSAGSLSAKGAAAIFETLVRPVVEYAGELEGGAWEEAERIQLLAGRLVLGVGKEMANEVVRGDLGWWTLRGRRDCLRLVFWGKLVRGKADGATARVYK